MQAGAPSTEAWLLGRHGVAALGPGLPSWASAESPWLGVWGPRGVGMGAATLAVQARMNQTFPGEVPPAQGHFSQT